MEPTNNNKRTLVHDTTLNKKPKTKHEELPHQILENGNSNSNIPENLLKEKKFDILGHLPREIVRHVFSFVFGEEDVLKTIKNIDLVCKLYMAKVADPLWETFRNEKKYTLNFTSVELGSTLPENETPILKNSHRNNYLYNLALDRYFTGIYTQEIKGCSQAFLDFWVFLIRTQRS